MADINADVEDVLRIQSEKIARLEQENAILSARLLSAGRMLDEQEAAKAEAPSAKSKDR